MLNRLAAILVAVIAFLVALALCLVSGNRVEADGSYSPLRVHDRFLLTPEQQRELVREGSVTVELPGYGEHTFYNTEEMRPYLNEGGAM